MNALLSVVFGVGVILLQPKKHTEPVIESHYSNNEYVLANPLNVSVVITINCGHEFEKPNITMLPNSKESYKILDTNGKAHYTCFLESWKKL